MTKKKLYLITNALPFEIQLKKIKKILPLGLEMIQYRNKSVPWSKALEEIMQLKLLCDLYGVPLIINDRVDVLSLTHAQGVHLGLDDLPLAYATKVLSASKIIGATAKTVEQAVKSERDGAHYLGVGAFYPSETKDNALRMSTDTLRAIKENTSLPLFGIGGLTPANITKEIYDHVDGFAFSGCVLNHEDPKRIILDFLSL